VNPAIVFDEAQLPELVHGETDSWPRCANPEHMLCQWPLPAKFPTGQIKISNQPVGL
jgi:hypothetical protein